ncbi:DUF1667 domain-containing protein [Faecalibaculum rodentium]|nr:DUF1667 domain-containing protein [Faecalibaculum rodentium]
MGRALRSVRTATPVRIGAVILADPAETGVDVFAARMVEAA